MSVLFLRLFNISYYSSWAYVHGSVNEMSKAYLLNDRRHNYTTPKSFLELINLYVKTLTSKHEELDSKMKRLENGPEKLRVTAAQVAELKTQLAEQVRLVF